MKIVHAFIPMFMIELPLVLKIYLIGRFELKSGEVLRNKWFSDHNFNTVLEQYAFFDVVFPIFLIVVVMVLEKICYAIAFSENKRNF